MEMILGKGCCVLVPPSIAIPREEQHFGIWIDWEPLNVTDRWACNEILRSVWKSHHRNYVNPSERNELKVWGQSPRTFYSLHHKDLRNFCNVKHLMDCYIDALNALQENNRKGYFKNAKKHSSKIHLLLFLRRNFWFFLHLPKKWLDVPVCNGYAFCI